MLIQTIDEIVDLFPSVSGESDGELHSSCPFCTEGRKTVKNGIVFRGDDRLVWFADRKGVSCRHCGTYAPMQRLLDLLSPGSTLATDFVTEASEAVETKKKPLEDCLTSEDYVDKLHSAVKRDFWKSFLWTDATIDRFKLGYGQLYEYGTFRLPRHIIPFKPRNTEKELDGYTLEGRLNNRQEESDFERYNVKTQGSVKGFFWLIKDGESEEIAIVEGPKDAITAWQLGYKHVMAIFGTSNWRPHFGAWVADEGYKKGIIFGDNDDAGRKFIDNVTRDLHLNSVTPYCIAWPNTVAPGFDLTNALQQETETGIAAFLTRYIRHSKATRGWVANIQTFDPNYEPPTTEKALPLQEVRADMPALLTDFVDNYKIKAKSAGRGVVKILASPPGSGKSYALVQLAQQEAQKLIDRKENFRTKYTEAREELLQQIEEAEGDERQELKERIENLDKRAEAYSMAKVLFASPFINAWEDITSQPGFDERLWFNFESRNMDTCKNYETASVLGAKGYSVMKFCETSCAFAEDCASRVGGYLLQLKLMKTRPITFVRHANLINHELLKRYEIVIIDENFLNVFTDFVEIEDLIPASRSWRDFLNAEEEDAADDIEALGNAIKALNSLEEELSGLDCLKALEKALNEPLGPLLRGLPESLVKKFQPFAMPANTDIKDLPPCVFPVFYRAVMDELSDFEKGEPYNSRIHLAKTKFHGYRLKVSTLFPIELPRSKKIIVADGTALPELYGLFFDREVELYQPEIYNPSAKIVQLTGTDMTRGSISRQVGSKAYRTLGQSEKPALVVKDILGEEIELDDIEYTEDIYNSTALTGLLQLLKSIALDEKHKRTLFVTYKNVRMALEERIRQLAETDDDYAQILKRVAFGHYGGLRGTNRYKDYDTVLLAGCPRQPYTDLWQVIQAWARLKGYDKYIPNKLGYTAGAYHGLGLYSGYSYITFEDSFAQAFVDMVEVGEIRQCLDRIRIYSGGEKTAYLYMARPAAKWVTEVTSSRKKINRLQDALYNEIEAFVAEIWNEYGAVPKIRTVAAEFKITRRQAQDRIEAAKKALNIVSV